MLRQRRHGYWLSRCTKAWQNVNHMNNKYLKNLVKISCWEFLVEYFYKFQKMNIEYEHSLQKIKQATLNNWGDVGWKWCRLHIVLLVLEISLLNYTKCGLLLHFPNWFYTRLNPFENPKLNLINWFNWKRLGNGILCAYARWILLDRCLRR